MSHYVLWLTDRGAFHQQRALEAAPPILNVSILSSPPADILHEALFRAEVLISERRGRIDNDFLQMAPNLKLIVRVGALLDDIDLHALKAHDVRLVQQPDLTTIMVAEHCLLMILALLKKLNAAQKIAQNPDPSRRATRTDENTFSYNWASMGDIKGLYGKRIAIIGMGEIGIELAQRLGPFRLAALSYFKRSRLSRFLERELGLRYVDSPEAAAADADVVVNLLPYDAETDLLLGGQLFAKMPRGALFVHAGSGATVNEQALVNAINIGHLGGAALDTFTHEPLQVSNPLIELSKDPIANVILTPHIGAATLPHEQTARVLTFQEIMRFFRNLPLHNEVPLP